MPLPGSVLTKLWPSRFSLVQLFESSFFDTAKTHVLAKRRLPLRLGPGHGRCQMESPYFYRTHNAARKLNIKATTTLLGFSARLLNLINSYLLLKLFSALGQQQDRRAVASSWWLPLAADLPICTVMSELVFTLDPALQSSPRL